MHNHAFRIAWHANAPRGLHIVHEAVRIGPFSFSVQASLGGRHYCTPAARFNPFHYLAPIPAHFRTVECAAWIGHSATPGAWVRLSDLDPAYSQSENISPYLPWFMVRRFRKLLKRHASTKGLATVRRRIILRRVATRIANQSNIWIER